MYFIGEKRNKSTTVALDCSLAILAPVALLLNILESFEQLWYYSVIQSLYRHVVCNVQVSCKTNRDRNQLEAWLDSDP